MASASHSFLLKMNLSKPKHPSLEVSYHSHTFHVLTLKFENVSVQIRKTILFAELVWLLVVARTGGS